MKNILFVCTGNTCRSPMAEGLFNHAAERAGLDWRASSAGLFVMPGSQVSENSVAALGEQGIDISSHKPVQLTPELVGGADLVLTMSETHRRIIDDMISGAVDKVFTLGVYAGTAEEISDPFGSDKERYRNCMLEIKRCLDAVIKRLSEQ